MLTGLSLGLLSPARAAEDPTPADPAAGVTQTVDAASDAVGDTLSVPADHEEAQAALDEVEDLFGPMTHAESRSLIRSGESKDATLALRDLSLRLGSLSRAERSSAYAEFQRPWTTDSPGSPKLCAANVCVHYLKASDAAARGVPSWKTDPAFAQTVLDTMVHVSQTYTAAGYRQPRSDATYGGDGRTDIYLADVGAQGKYGYCTVDVNDAGQYVFRPSNARASDLPAFCVLDNDYSKDQFPTRHSSVQDLQVTAAHEYFHATQFAYDYLEDRWFMEATATWAEDQVYDAINDNLQYLQRSQLRYPGVSLDTYNGAGGFLHYGDWIYFAYLTQRSPARRGALPSLMLRMWQYADSVSGPDLYSIRAVSSALAERHLGFTPTFAQYAAANRHPSTAYSDEGMQRYYPTTRPKRTVRLRPGKRTTSAAFRINHLASATTRFIPRRLPGSHRLKLSVNMANKRSGSGAEALVFYKSGRITTKGVRLGRSGNGTVRLPFSSRRVARVELVLVNANHAYRRCWVNSVYSCSGTPAHNQVKETVKARVS